MLPKAEKERYDQYILQPDVKISLHSIGDAFLQSAARTASVKITGGDSRSHPLIAQRFADPKLGPAAVLYLLFELYEGAHFAQSVNGLFNHEPFAGVLVSCVWFRSRFELM